MGQVVRFGRTCTHKSRLFGNRWLNVRFTPLPISGHRPTRRACPLSARTGLPLRRLTTPDSGPWPIMLAGDERADTRSGLRAILTALTQSPAVTTSIGGQSLRR